MRDEDPQETFVHGKDLKGFERGEVKEKKSC